MMRKVFWNIRQGDMVGLFGLLLLLTAALAPIVKFFARICH